MKFALLSLALILSAAAAGDLTSSGGDAFPSRWNGTDAETILLSQLPTGSAYSSQKFADNDSTLLDSGIADDFQFSVSTTINKIRWWGQYWNPGPGPFNCDAQIYIYADDGSGSAPTLPEHSSALMYFHLPAGSYTETADGGNFVYEYIFPSWVIFDPGVTYWIEIRKVLPFSTGGQWGLVASTPVSMSQSVQGIIGFGTSPYWTPLTDIGSNPVDVAFQLIWDDSVELSRNTWASIKSIF